MVLVASATPGCKTLAAGMLIFLDKRVFLFSYSSSQEELQTGTLHNLQKPFDRGRAQARPTRQYRRGSMPDIPSIAVNANSFIGKVLAPCYSSTTGGASFLLEANYIYS